MFIGLGIGINRQGDPAGGGPVPTETTLTYSSPSATVEVDGNRSTRDHLFGVKSVVVPGGGAAINAITPAEELVGGDKVHGAMLNPQRNSGTFSLQSFDERTGDYVDADNVQGNAFSLTPNDILLKSVAKTDVVIGTANDRRAGIVEGYAHLYAVSTLPAVDAIPPSPIGWTGRNSFAWETVDWDAKVAALPECAVPGGTTPVTYAQLQPYMKLNPIPALMDGTGDTGGYEVFSPRNWGGDITNYGRYPGVIYNENMALFLTLPTANASDADKKAVLQFMAIQGRWWFEAMKGSAETTVADGGHYRFQAVCIEAYLWATDQLAEMDALATNATTNQYHQYYELTAGQLAQFETPHDEFAKPFPARRRDITSVSTLNVQVNQRTSTAEADSDDVRLRLTGMQMVRESDGDTARVDAMVSNVTPYEFTIDAQPSPAFAVNDVVTFLGEAAARVAGTFHFAVKGIAGDNFRLAGMAEDDEYRGFAKDGALAFFRRALGYYRAVHAETEGYVVQTWDGDFPALYPWPDPFETLNPMSGVAVWAEAFVREHGPSVIPALAAPDPVSLASDTGRIQDNEGNPPISVDLPAGKYAMMLLGRWAANNPDLIGALTIAGVSVTPTHETRKATDKREHAGLWEFTLTEPFNGTIQVPTGNRRYFNFTIWDMTGWDVVSATTQAANISANVLAGDTLIAGSPGKNNNPTFGAFPVTFTDSAPDGSYAYAGGIQVVSADASPLEYVGSGEERWIISVVLRPS